MKKICTFIMMLVFSTNLFAQVHIIEPYYWQTGVNTENRSLDIAVVDDRFLLNFTQSQTNLQIQILDADDNVCYVECVQVEAGADYVVYVGNLPEGLYQLVLTTTEGEIIVKSFFKQ